jgi:hypothetical protein
MKLLTGMWVLCLLVGFSKVLRDSRWWSTSEMSTSTGASNELTLSIYLPPNKRQLHTKKKSIGNIFSGFWASHSIQLIVEGICRPARGLICR